NTIKPLYFASVTIIPESGGNDNASKPERAAHSAALPCLLHAVHGLLHHRLHDGRRHGSRHIAVHVAVGVNHKGGGKGGNAVIGQSHTGGIHEHREGVTVVLQELLDLLLGYVLSAGVVHRQHHQVLAVFSITVIQLLDVGHFALAGAAPSGPEVEEHRLALVVGQSVGVAVLIGEGKVGGGNLRLGRGL